MADSDITAVIAPVLEFDQNGIPEHLITMLSGEELSRLSKIHDYENRAEFISGRILLRTTLSEILDIQPSEIKISIRKNGRPYLENALWNFSLSHAGGYVVISVSKNKELGIDIESLDVAENDSLMRRNLNKIFYKSSTFEANIPAKSLIDSWCMCEAFAKCVDQDVLSSAKSEEFKIISNQRPDSGWRTGPQHSIWLSAIAGGRISLAVCTDTQPVDIIYKEIDLTARFSIV